jgi:hypothetical protein
VQKVASSASPRKSVVILNDSEGSAVVLIDPKGKKQILHFIQDDRAED